MVTFVWLTNYLFCSYSYVMYVWALVLINVNIFHRSEQVPIIIIFH